MGVFYELKGKDLDLIVHSPGGSPEATEAIVTYLRSKFNDIRVIVPQAAMSAATMLA
jgi:ClpP class serine protease